MAKYIIIIGMAIVLAGVILYFFPNAFRWIGRLPGDIRIKNNNTNFYFPITSMIIISVVLSLLLNIIRRML